MSASTIARWNAIPMSRTDDSSKRRREDDEDKNVNDDDDDDVSLVSRSPSHEPMDVDTAGNDHISKYDEYHRGPEREIITVETRIKPTNKGFAMLAKLGWVEGQPLGISGEGRVDPIPFYVKNDLTGLGKTSQDFRMIETTVAQRRGLDSERQQKETDEQRKAREELVARRTALASEISTTLRAFYCALCEKQFQTITQYDEHTNSYAHHHKARLKDMQANARIVPKEESDRRKEKERKREERELRKIAAANGIRMAKPSVPPAIAPLVAPASGASASSSPSPLETPASIASIGDAPKKAGGWVSVSSSSSASQALPTTGFKRSGWATVGGPSPSPTPPPPPPPPSEPPAPPPPAVPPPPSSSTPSSGNQQTASSLATRLSAPSFRTGGWTHLSDDMPREPVPAPFPPPPPTSSWQNQSPPPLSPHRPTPIQVEAPDVPKSISAPVPTTQPVRSGWQQFKQSGPKRR